MSSRLNYTFGADAVFKKENATDYYQDSIRSKEIRHIAPVEQTQVGVQSTSPNAARYQFTFETQCEHWTRMDEIYFHLEATLTFDGVAYVNFLVPHNRLLAPAFSIAQNFFDVQIWINGVPIINYMDWSCIPGFLWAVDKNKAAIDQRVGLPFQRLIQEGANAIGKTTRFYSIDLDFDYTSTTLTNSNVVTQKFLVPLAVFSNLFAQPNYFPPGTKIRIQTSYQNNENFLSVGSNPPGTTWAEVNAPDQTNNTAIVVLFRTIHLQLNYYKISSTLANEFMETWKQQPFIIKFFRAQPLAFPQTSFGGTMPPVGRILKTRLEIDNPINSCLLMFCAIEKQQATGYDTYAVNLVGGNQYCVFAYPNPAGIGSTGARLKMCPFKIDFLKVYTEDNTDPIVDFTATAANADIIYHFLKNETKNYFRVNDQKQSPLATFDIYGYRCAPFFIPLHSERYLNQNFGAIPKRASYLIDYSVSMIDNTPLPTGYEIYFYVARQSTLQINNDLTTSVFDNPLMFNGSVVEDISKN